jgi:hypothetical protein
MPTLSDLSVLLIFKSLSFSGLFLSILIIKSPVSLEFNVNEKQGSTIVVPDSVKSGLLIVTLFCFLLTGDENSLIKFNNDLFYQFYTNSKA